MSKIYAIIGQAQQTIVNDDVNYSPSNNEILMQSERPTDGDYVAKEDGTWIKDKSNMINELDNQYNQSKDELLKCFSEAQLLGDTELQEELKQEINDLNDWYDEEYRKIQND